MCGGDVDDDIYTPESVFETFKFVNCVNQDTPRLRCNLVMMNRRTILPVSLDERTKNILVN